MICSFKNSKQFLLYFPLLLPIDSETRLISLLKSILLVFKPICIYVISEQQSLYNILFGFAYVFSITAALTITLTVDLKEKANKKHIKFQFIICYITSFALIKIFSVLLILQSYFMRLYERRGDFEIMIFVEGFVLIIGIALQNEFNQWLNYNINNTYYCNFQCLKPNQSCFTIWIPGLFFVCIIAAFLIGLLIDLSFAMIPNLLVLITIALCCLGMNFYL